MASVLRDASGNLDGLKDGVNGGSRSLANDRLSTTRKTFVETYYVKASAGDTEEQVLTATGLPTIGQLKRKAFCIDKRAREISASALLWEVDAIFDSHIDPTRPKSVQHSWSAETIEQVLERDPQNGKPIVNGVQEPLLVTSVFPLPVLTITRIEDEFRPDTMLQYMNKVNSHNFWGAPPQTALMASITDEPIDLDGLQKRRVTYVIKFNPKRDGNTGQILGWRLELLNHGTKYLQNAGDDPNTAALPFLADDVPVTGNLNEDGTKRSADIAPHYLTFNRFPRINFNTLRLGPFT